VRLAHEFSITSVLLYQLSYPIHVGSNVGFWDQSQLLTRSFRHTYSVKYIQCLTSEDDYTIINLRLADPNRSMSIFKYVV